MNQYVITVLACCVLSACGSDGDGSAGQDFAQCDGGLESQKHFVDNSGDAAFDFIDMENLVVTQTATTITAEITLLDIPASLTYNNVNVPDNYLEYSWELWFDVDCDGTRANNILLAVTHFKFSGTTQSQAALLDFTQKNIWEGDENGGGFASIDDISTSVMGSKLTMSVERSVYDRLNDINDKTPLRFKTSYNPSTSLNYDYYPDQDDSYTN